MIKKREVIYGKIIAIANQKGWSEQAPARLCILGGVGKTTTTVSLAHSLSRNNKRTLVVDLDSQANLTMSFGLDPDELDENKTIHALFIETIRNISNNTEIKDINQYIHSANNIDILASDITLSAMDNTLVNVVMRESILKRILSLYSDRYDYIIIDCMPSLTQLTINALTAADSVIIPVESHYLSLKGLEQLINHVVMVQKNINPHLTIEGVLITMHDTRTKMARNVEIALKNEYSQFVKIFKTTIPRSIRASEASLHGKSIQNYDPHGKVAIAYESFAREVM